MKYKVYETIKIQILYKICLINNNQSELAFKGLIV